MRRRYRSPRLLVLVAAFVSLASLAVAATAAPPVWWSDPNDPDAFLRAAAIMGGIGGGLKLLTQWERNPGWPRVAGALGLGPFVGCVMALLLFGSYRTSAEELMKLLGYCAAAGFCCDWVTARFVDLLSRVFTAGGSK